MASLLNSELYPNYKASDLFSFEEAAAETLS
jgi:hypothetical protein